MDEKLMKVLASIAEAIEKSRTMEFCFMLTINELSSVEAALMTTALQFKNSSSEEDKKIESELLAIIKKLDAQYKAQTNSEE